MTMPTATEIKITAHIEDSLYAMLSPDPCDFCGCRGLCYIDPETQARFCLPCLERAVDAQEEPEFTPIDPAIVAIGQEVVRHLRTANDDVSQSTVLFGEGCSECGDPGPTWHIPENCEYFCPRCLQNYITWEEAQLAQARTALTALTQFTRSEAA